ncbi:hypothetical protein D3C76_1640640 [compost metagenome]
MLQAIERQGQVKAPRRHVRRQRAGAGVDHFGVGVGLLECFECGKVAGTDQQQCLRGITVKHGRQGLLGRTRRNGNGHRSSSVRTVTIACPDIVA